MPNCKNDEILNPKTNRCVKRSGKIGMELLRKAIEKKPSPIPLYIPAYLRQEEIKPPTNSFKTYLKNRFSNSTEKFVKVLGNILKIMIRDIVSTTSTFVKSLNKSKKVLRADDLKILLSIYDVDIEKVEKCKLSSLHNHIQTFVKKIADKETTLKMDQSSYDFLSKLVLVFLQNCLELEDLINNDMEKLMNKSQDYNDMNKLVFRYIWV